MDNQNKKTIKNAVNMALKNDEKLIVVTETNILASNSNLAEIERVLLSALAVFRQKSGEVELNRE